ncbi:MAG: hypothetical protein WA667_14550 [Candidatus Nitrosopolaris sp.]
MHYGLGMAIICNCQFRLNRAGQTAPTAQEQEQLEQDHNSNEQYRSLQQISNVPSVMLLV